MTVPIAVLASGRGSNLSAIHHAIQNRQLDAEIVAVVSDRPGAPVLERAREWGLNSWLVPVDTSAPLEERRRLHETKILEALRPLGPRFLVLAGYMRILTPLLIDAFRCDKGYSRMVNIHPSLLPAFPGAEAYAQAFRYGVKWTGVTVHLVEPVVDSGPICAQEGFSIEGLKSVEEVEKRGLEIEHRLYPQSLKWILPEKFSLEERSGGRFCVCPN